MTDDKTGDVDRETCAGPRPAAGLARIAFLVLRLWPERHSQRTRLSELDSEQLRDIGIDRRQALREARKPFWR